MTINAGLIGLFILLTIQLSPIVAEVPPPIQNGIISSEFGKRLHPIFKKLRFHSGVDIVGNKDSRVFSVGTGLIIFAGNYQGYGNLVVIRHSNQITTHYAHLDAFSVAVGEIAHTGSEIGRVGNTGDSFGAHLHFEIRKNGTPINPKLAIPSLKRLGKE